jgi:hypothetical protein
MCRNNPAIIGRNLSAAHDDVNLIIALAIGNSKAYKRDQ